MTSYCRSCRVELPAKAKFCGKCGTPSRLHVRAVVARGRNEQRQALRSAAALGSVCAGTFFSLLAIPAWLPDEREWPRALADAGALVVIGLFAGAISGGLRGSVPLSWSWRWLTAAVVGAAMTVLFGIAYVGVVFGGLGESVEVPGSVTVVSVAVFAPLVEEWLCRGVAWRAATTMANARTAWVLTTVLFAFLHGLNGNFLLELPHRAFAGLVFGWLRWRSGSLVPGILAHALHNAAALIRLGS